MTLELRDGAPVKKTTYHKVTNPDNPAQHIYLREDIYVGLVDELDNGAMNFSFKALWEGAKNVVNKVIQVVKQAVPGGGGASPGGGGGFPILTNAQGQPTIVVTAPVPPPAALPPQYMQTTAKDNTMMYVLGAAAIGAVLLLKK